RLIFARNVSSGARIFDNQISGLMNVEGEAAEAVKIQRATLGAPANDAEAEDELRGPVRSAAGQLAGFITSSINFARTQLNDRELAVDKVYLSGGGARLEGLAEYLQGALKAPVEILDPFRGIDTAAVEAAGAGDVRELPSDLAIAVGLAQLVSPPASAAERTLSILPDPLKKRRRFFRTWLWMSAAGAMVGAVLLVLTGLAIVRRSQERAELERFTAKTADVRKRMDDMKTLAGEQRDLLARADLLQSYVGGGRSLLDVMARLRKAVPAQGMAVSGFHLGGASKRDEGGDRLRAAFVVKRRGAVSGEIESESSEQIKLAGHPEPYLLSDIEGDVLRWPGGVRSLVVVGDVDENIRGGPREALMALRDQLTDASRGVRAGIRSQRASPRPGWRTFEIVVSFE
ncbi:MAG TPA: pilus assembly protein PilM, partial [Planctomycetota bacterium]|nr:pilus assembly protein PilM [Planctomycetota bacterium]